MQEVALQAGIDAVIDAVVNDRLALLAGAGLSMAPPSSLPAAAGIAASAKQKYDAMFGATRPPLATRIEDQAQFFFERGELGSFYFRSLIDQNIFAGPPNPGHYAVADLLLVRAIQTAITTNVDTLIETAGQMLFGQIGVGIDRNAVASLSPDVSPLLKIHGCRVIDCPNMVWAPGQLAAAPVAARIADNANWLSVRLLDRDLLVVGYWTDWTYLNAVLAGTLGAVRPARVIIVDPADSSTFAAKAPDLYALGQRASVAFQHVRTSGADFLDAVRNEFSRSFVRRVLHSGANEYVAQIGNNPNAAWMEPPHLDNVTLWQIRRDLEGCIPNQPAKERSPPPGNLVGLTLLQLQAGGASADGPYWVLNGRRIRVLRTVDKMLHRVEAEFAREMAPAVAPDIVIAVGAEAQTLPANIARAESEATIARGSKSRWVTRLEALQELGL